MNRFFIIIAALFLLLPSFAHAQENEGEDKATAQPAETGEGEEKPAAEQPTTEQPAAEQPAATTEEKKSPEEEPFDEGLFEEEQEAMPAKPTGAPGEETKTPPRKITIDAVIIVKYVYQDSGESYSVKYHINMGGKISADIGMIKGNAKVATDISGFLAKSPVFECILKVSIADVPYEIMFKKMSDKEADINVAFKGQILEDWESLCTFLDTSNAKFNTRGMPERWIGIALEKAKPPLSKLTTPIDSRKATTVTFTIPKQSIPDESIGSVDIEGTGVVTTRPELRPSGAPGKTGEDEEAEEL